MYILRTCGVLLVLVVIAAGYGARYLSESAVNEFKTTILRNTLTAATAFDDIPFAKMFGKHYTIYDQNYNHVLAHLKHIIAVNNSASYTYLMGTRNNRIFFYADWSDDHNSDISRPGDPYLEASQKLKSVFAFRRSVTEETTDRWGSWVSALVPVKDSSTHRVVALLGIDYSRQVATSLVAIRRIPALAIAMLVCILIIASTLIFFIQNDAAIQIEESMLRAKNAEKEALDHSLFLQTLIDSIPSPVFYKTIDGIYLGCNKAFEEISGIPADKVIGSTVFDITPSELAPKYHESDLSLCRTGGKQVYESHIVNAAGDLRDVIFNKALFCDSSGESAGIIGTIGDITEIRAMETDLALEKNRLQITLQSIGDAVIATDNNGYLTLINTVAQKLTGWSESEAIGLPLCQVFNIINDHNGESAENPVDKVLRTGEIVELANHTSIISRNGDRCSIADSCAPIRDENGVMVGAVLVFRDVSEQYETQRKIRDAELRYRTLFDESPNGVCLVDVETGIPIEFNEIAHTMLGYTREEFAVMPVYMHHEDMKDKYNALQLWDLPVGERADIDTRMLAKDNHIVDVHISLGLIEIGGRKLCSSIILDTTWLKQVEIELAQSERRFRSLVQNSSDVIWIVDQNGTILYSSSSVERIMGYSIENVMYSNAFIYLESKYADMLRRRFEYGLEHPGEEVYWEARACRHDGSYIWIEGIGRNMLDDTNIRGVVINFSDITERKTQQAIERMQNTAVNAASDQIVITDPEGCITFVNHSFETETGYSAKEVLGHKPNILSSGRHDLAFYENMWLTIKAGRIWSGEVVNKRKDKTLYVDDMNITPVKNDQDVIECFIAIKRNVTDRKSYEEQLDHLAHHDNLTGLPNRLMFNDRLNHSLMIARTSQKRLAVLFIDLDRFKNINDTLGHNMGDTLLKESAERFKNSLRESDILARMGGDEFTVIVNDIRSEQDVFCVAERIQNELSRAFVLDNHEVIISASIGISMYPESGMDSRTLIMNADTAMYRAKEQGRNNCLLYSETMNTRAMERLKLEYGLRGALDRQEFVLHYQPRINTRSGELIGAEALLRWNHPEAGLVPPADFIPMAEETGLIVQIGQWVISEAARQNYEWQKAGFPPVCISVNVSPRQFQQTDILLAAFQSIMDNPDMPISFLEVEITEGALMDHPEEAINALEKLKEMGLRISIDDFGTGYSSLSYLKRFPIDAVKIDRSFIKDVHINPEDASICCAIMAMAHNLGMTVVAEGVETTEQYDYMKSIDCDEIQGYLTGKPVTADKFKIILQQSAEDNPNRNVA
jgi:diguanylate cyclase (GGDEF)-like protein/PAS domain S-box-containing protein